jgi:FkbM family methyltransferase
MNRVLRLIAKAPNYVRRFGFLAGGRLLLGIERPLGERSSEIRAYKVPGLDGPVYLRESVSDHAIIRQCLVRSRYDTRRFPHNERLMAAYRQMLSAGAQPLIIDCGANIGLASVWFAEQFPEARICAIEPDGENFALLKRNVARFGDRVMALRGGVWNEGGWLRIRNAEAGAAAFQVLATSADDPEALRTYTIPEVCALAGVESAIVVKIDIEGAQKQLFRSNTDWVAKTLLIAMELDDWLLPWQGTSRPFFSCLSRYPFEYLMSGETMFCFLDVIQSDVGLGANAAFDSTAANLAA